MGVENGSWNNENDFKSPFTPEGGGNKSDELQFPTSPEAPYIFPILTTSTEQNTSTTQQESPDLTPEKVAEYTEIVSKEIPEIIKLLEERRKRYEKLTGRKHPTVFEFDGNCGAGKTSAHLVLEVVLEEEEEEEQKHITTDDYNKNPYISKAAFAKKKEAKTLEEKALAGDKGAFKLELIKWFRIYDQVIDKLETEKASGTLTEEKIDEISKVYSTRGIVTLVAHAFARQSSGDIAFPKEIAGWMLNLLDSGAVPLPALFGYISPENIDINQNRILQRQAERVLGHTLRRQDVINFEKYKLGEIKPRNEEEKKFYEEIEKVFEAVEETRLYRREDQEVHKLVLEHLVMMMEQEGFYPTILASGSVSTESIARGIVRSSEILSTNPENSKVVGRVFRQFLEQVQNGEISAESIFRKAQEKEEFVEEISALGYFEKHHTNDYGFDWTEFEDEELNAGVENYRQEHPKQYEIFEQQVMGGLDVVIPYRNGSVENLNQTLKNLQESFNQLLLYLPENKRDEVKLNIVIVDQESDEPLEPINHKQGEITTRVVQAKKHPNYDFDVDACRGEGIKYTEMQNTLFLDHEVFLHPETLTRFYKTIAKTKSKKGLEAITCCSSTVDKVTQSQLNRALTNQRNGDAIEITKDWTVESLEKTNYLKNLGGLWQDQHGFRPIYGFLRPGIHFLPTEISRHTFETSLPIGGYGKEQAKYIQTFIENNGNIFVIMDPNEETRVYTIKAEGLEGHQKTPKKTRGLRENGKLEEELLGNTRIEIHKKPDRIYRFEVIRNN